MEKEEKEEMDHKGKGALKILKTKRVKQTSVVVQSVFQSVVQSASASGQIK